MKFSCERDLLLNAVNDAQKAVSLKSLIPALEGILIRAKENMVTITGYDLEMGIESHIPANISQEGAVVLNARLFGEILRKLPSDTVELFEAHQEREMLTTILCGKIEYNIPSIKDEEFPELPTIEKENVFEIKNSVLKSMIRQTIFAVSLNDTKPVLTGIKMEIEKGQMRAIALDGYRLAFRKEPIETNEEASFIVPSKTMGEMIKLLSDNEEETVKFYVTKKHILFETENIVVVSRLLEGEFLNYNSAIPKDNKIIVNAETKKLIDCIERASLLISEKNRSPIRMNIENDQLEINCITQIGKVHDEMAITSQGGELEIGFNHRYMLDALKACENNEAVMEFNTPLSPCVIKPKEGESFLFLVLPVRLKAND